jgi:hypothetical protein
VGVKQRDDKDESYPPSRKRAEFNEENLAGGRHHGRPQEWDPGRGTYEKIRTLKEWLKEVFSQTVESHVQRNGSPRIEVEAEE